MLLHLNTQKIYCFILLFILSSQINAQVINEKRIEFDLDEGYEDFDLTPFGSDGILMYAKAESGSSWEVVKYDNDLQAGTKKDIAVPKSYALNKQYETGKQLTLLFSDRKGNYLFYRIDADDMHIEKQQGKLPSKRMYISELIVSGDIAYLSGNAKKVPVLMKVNLASGKSEVVPISISHYTAKYLDIDNMQVLEGSGDVMVYIRAINKKDLNMYVMHLDNTGKKTNTYELSENTEKKFTSISASPVTDGYIFTGTYSTKSNSGSEGMYICKTSGEKVEFLQFYNFLDFNEFLSYMSEKRKEKLEKKKERKEDKDKDFAVNYLIADHEILEMNDEYIFIGEAYYPTYHTETRTTTTSTGTTTTTVTVFDGYQYTHATVVGFNKEGEKLWDRNFEMSPGYKPYTVKRFISVSTADDVVSLLFASNNSIHSVSFGSDGNIKNEKSTDLIKEKSDDEKIKSTYSNMQYWFDNHFIAYGYQTIKNKEESIGNKKRKVYFITKINYE